MVIQKIKVDKWFPRGGRKSILMDTKSSLAKNKKLWYGLAQ